MKKLVTVLLALLFVPSVSFAAALTPQQSTSLISVVQSSPGTPASAFVSLITAFSNITINQATSLISVVQAAPGVPANAFVNLLTSFTADTAVAQSAAPAVVTPTVTTQATQANQQTTQSVTPTAIPSQVTTQASSVSSAQINPPSVDIKIQGSDGPIVTPANGPALIVSWTSQNVIDCGITGNMGWGGNWGTSGSRAASFSAPINVVTIQCSALVNNTVVPNAVSDSVTVNVTPPPPASSDPYVIADTSTMSPAAYARTLTGSTCPNSPVIVVSPQRSGSGNVVSIDGDTFTWSLSSPTAKQYLYLNVAVADACAPLSQVQFSYSVPGSSEGPVPASQYFDSTTNQGIALPVLASVTPQVVTITATAPGVATITKTFTVQVAQ